MLIVRRINHGEANMYRSVRLRALRDAPDAFTTTYAEALAREPETWREQSDRAATDTHRAIFLALWSGEPVGLAALYSHPELNNTGELLQVWVAAAHRGDGTASTLLDTLLHWGVREAGFRLVLAEVKISNLRALGFYHKYGFVTAEGHSASDPEEIVLAWRPSEGGSDV